MIVASVNVNRSPSYFNISLSSLPIHYEATIIFIQFIQFIQSVQSEIPGRGPMLSFAFRLITEENIDKAIDLREKYMSEKDNRYV
jgi:hypothetical protein